MSRRGIMLALAALLAVLSAPFTGGSVASGSVSSGSAASAAADVSTPDAVLQLGSCLAGGSQGRILLLLDTSSSLGGEDGSDPTGQRITAADDLVDQLGQFVDRSKAKIDVAVAGFAEKFAVSQEWTALGGGGTESVRRAVEAYRDQVHGFETDYWLALDGARQYLADVSQDGDCTAVVWLTDGSYDLDARDSRDEQETYGVSKPYGPDGLRLTDKEAEEALERAGARDLCRSGGVADALRAQGITTFAVGLQGKLAASKFDLMRGVATGSKVDGRSCGERPARGEFALAGDFASLFLVLDMLSDPRHPPVVQTTPYCQGELCPDYPHQFVLDPSISTVRILGGSELADFIAVLISPSGQQIQILPEEPIDSDYGSFSLAGSWPARSVFSLKLTRGKEPGWTGVWQVVFVDPKSTDQGEARSNIRLYGDLEPVWSNPTSSMQIGEQPQLTFGLQQADGTPVEPTSLEGQVELSAFVDHADGTTEALGEPQVGVAIGTPLELDLKDASPEVVHIRVALSLTTAGIGDIEGTTLAPQSRSYEVAIKAPPTYPVPDDPLLFGDGESADPVTKELPISGDGCVWLAGATSDSRPEGIDTITLSSPASSQETCVSGSLPVTLTPSGMGSGHAGGTLQVMTLPADAAGPPVGVDVDYGYHLVRPPGPTRPGIFLALLLAAILIPILVFAAFKRWSATLAGDSLAWLTVSGPVGPGGHFLSNTRLKPSQVESLSLADLDNPRKVTLSQRVTLVARADWRNPISPGYVIVKGARFWTSKTDKRLPLAVQNSWIITLDPNDPNGGEVEVILLLPYPGAPFGELQREVISQLGEKVATLRDAGPIAGPGLDPGLDPGQDSGKRRGFGRRRDGAQTLVDEDVQTGAEHYLSDNDDDSGSGRPW